MAVESVMRYNQMPVQSVELGKVKLIREPTKPELENIKLDLKKYELELVEGKNLVLVELIKAEIIRLLNSSQHTSLKLSAHLSKTLDYNYTYLANTFSLSEGYTVEKFFITQRVERVKELLVYEDKSLTDIAEDLNFSSVSHLCLQFRKVTNITPMEFRKLLQSDDYVWRKV